MAFQSVGRAPVRSTIVPSRGAHIPQVDFKSFFKTIADRFKELSRAMVDDDLPLNIPEYGIYNVTGDKKTSLGVSFALSTFLSQGLENPFTLSMSLYTKSNELLYDEPNKILMGA